METEKAIQFVELAQRTLANYDFIFEARIKKEDEPIFEVTQLITGLIGIVVWPKEEYLDREKLQWKTLNDNLSENFPRNYVRDQDKTDQLSTYYQLINNLRHGFAHGSFEFLSGQGVITDIRISNIHGSHNWQGTISIKHLEEIARHFVYILNKSAVEKFMSDYGDTPIYRCSNCSFVWIGKEHKPEKCIYCRKDAQWQEQKEHLSFADINHRTAYKPPYLGK